ncbi:MAG: hypothetical protein ACRC5C_14415, partial [Bacilli bacterium]
PDKNREVTIPEPTITFQNVLTLKCGKYTLSIQHVEADHAPDCAIVHIEETNVVFLGDCVYMDMFTDPWCYRKDRLLPLLDELKRMRADIYIPSHSPAYSNEKFRSLVERANLISKIVHENDHEQAAIDDFEATMMRMPTDEERDLIVGFTAHKQMKNKRER